VHRCESKKSALNPQGQRALALVPGCKCYGKLDSCNPNSFFKLRKADSSGDFNTQGYKHKNNNIQLGLNIMSKNV